MHLKPGMEVRHAQWGRGVVVFDKPHCICIKFVEHGRVNFTQEEWAAGHSPPERLHGGISELEFRLGAQVENGNMSEQRANGVLKSLETQASNRQRNVTDVNLAYADYIAAPCRANEDTLLESVRRLVRATVSKNSHDRATFTHLEDVITASLIEVWRKLKKYDPLRGSFRTWVVHLTLMNIKDALRAKARRNRYTGEHILLTEDSVMGTRGPRGMTPLNQILFQEWLQDLSTRDRTILQMLRDGLSQGEIAEALGVSQQAIAKRIKKIKQVVMPPFQVE